MGSFVPGPVRIVPQILAAAARDYGSADLETGFFARYGELQDWLGELLGVADARHGVVLLPGEGMLGLWAVVKSSVLRAGRTRALVLANGVFGDGFADMLGRSGADTRVLRAAYDVPLHADLERVAAEVDEQRPDIVFAVHCETPSGVLNDVRALAPVARRHGALFAVDFVASAGGAPLRVDEWGIDFGMLGSQKVLGSLPDVSIVTLSPRAWERVALVDYAGYDALRPWRNVVAARETPYTFSFNALAALHTAVALYRAAGGPSAAFDRHLRAARLVRARLRAMRVRIFADRGPDADALDDSAAAGWSPTVTVAFVPDGWAWPELNKALRDRGVIFAGSWGKLAGAVFRIGHMGGPQTDLGELAAALDVLESVLAARTA
jgi:aspartate aminotransferase-like enzyme